MRLADTARLLRLRGQAMQEAVPVGRGAMAALLGLDLAAAEAVAAEAAQGEVCEAANDNDPAQVVVSGDTAAVERAVEIAKARGAKRAMLLPVSAPFHCALMQPAADAMAEALAEVAIAAPAVPLVANVVGRGGARPGGRSGGCWCEQVTGRVRWRESVAWMAGQGVTETVEIGAGKALSGMIRRIAKDDRDAGGQHGRPRCGRWREAADMFDLSGKAALVTGASGGIGGAIARALHGAGATVGAVGHAGGAARGAGGRARRAGARAALRPSRRARRSRRCRRRRRRRWGRSTSSSTTPGSPGTSCSCACRTRTGRRCSR